VTGLTSAVNVPATRMWSQICTFLWFLEGKLYEVGLQRSFFNVTGPVI